MRITSLVVPVVSAYCLSAIAAALLGAQGTDVHMPGTPSCGGCRIVEERLFKLGSPADPVRLADFGIIEQDSRGQFYAISEGYDHVLVFDPRGKYLRAIGRPGPGPGEFPSRIARIRVGIGDTLYVYVATTRRIDVLGPTGRFVRRLTVGGQVHQFFPTPTGFVAGVEFRTKDRAGIPFHVLDKNGTVLRSFGPPGVVGVPRPGQPRPRVTHHSSFALAPDGQSFLVFSTDYGFERWGLDGKQLTPHTLVDSPWFDRSAKGVLDSVLDGGRYRTFIALSQADAGAGGIDRDGLLWYTGKVPKPGTRGTANKELEWTLVREVVDPVTRRVLLSQPATRTMILIRGTDLGFSGVEDVDGFIRISIWRIRLVRP